MQKKKRKKRDTKNEDSIMLQEAEELLKNTETVLDELLSLSGQSMIISSFGCSKDVLHFL